MIRTDYKKIKPGDIYCALSNELYDGHGYINKAIKYGASKLIITHGKYNINTIKVKNTRDYLNRYLLRYNKFLSEMIIIGVTGTNGKTTTSYLIYQMLNNSGVKCSFIGDFGYYKNKKIMDIPHMEIDELYDMLMDSYKSDYKIVVIEVSCDNLINSRFDTIDFDIVIFTNLSEDHLNYHIDMDNYAYTKQKLFKRLKKSGVAIINNDDYYKNYFVLPNTITYGFLNSDYKIDNYVSRRDKTIFRYFHDDKYYYVKSNLLGMYNIYNLLACLIVMDYLNISKKNIDYSLNNISISKITRSINYKSNTIFIDNAHNIASIKAIINMLKEMKYNNIYVVFSGTDYKNRYTRFYITEYLLKNIKYGIITISNINNESINIIIDDMLNDNVYSNYCVELNRNRAITKGIKLLEDNDVLLILGSCNVNYLYINGEKVNFDDSLVVRKTLSLIQ